MRRCNIAYRYLRMKPSLAVVFALLCCTALASAQQDWIRTGTGLGIEKVRLAAADFKATTTEAPIADLNQAFNDTLFADLENAGIFDMVSKSFYPLQVPGTPQEINFGAWSNPPPNASMVAFGNLGVAGGQVSVQGWLFDVKNQQSPQVLGKQYREAATVDNARLIAHRFANEIIFRLGGGIQGIAESKIFFISDRSGHKEVWSMDYDGANQKQVTRVGEISLSPRVSPDGTRVAFSAIGGGGSNILMWSLELNRLVTFPKFGGTNASPAWSPDGKSIAFSSSRSGDPELYTIDADSGTGLKRLTNYRGTDISPCFNPKSGAQIAFVSGRTGLPQIYMMDADGANLQRMTDGGYAVSPSWSPNGQFLLFAWFRKYGPGEPGAQDVYIMDVASKQWVQLTTGTGRNDFPSWSPDGRHIVFQSNRSGSDQIWTMLADGTQARQLTTQGRNSMPNWSWR